MIAHVLILWGVIAVAAALGVVVHRKRTPEEAPEYQSALTFVGAAYGLLLGLLVVFAVGHYTDVRGLEEAGYRAHDSDLHSVALNGDPSNATGYTIVNEDRCD